MSRTWNEYEKAGLRHCVFFLYLRNCSGKKFKTHAAVPPWIRFVLTTVEPRYFEVPREMEKSPK